MRVNAKVGVLGGLLLLGSGVTMAGSTTIMYDDLDVDGLSYMMKCRNDCAQEAGDGLWSADPIRLYLQETMGGVKYHTVQTGDNADFDPDGDAAMTAIRTGTDAVLSPHLDLRADITQSAGVDFQLSSNGGPTTYEAAQDPGNGLNMDSEFVDLDFASTLTSSFDDFINAIAVVPGGTATGFFASIHMTTWGDAVSEGSDWWDITVYREAECVDGDCGGPIPPVPVPAAVWLFGSGLVGLIGASRKKKLSVLKA